MLTRCPHCGATFRVTEAHLNAAHGKVRCGACMAIFNATEHLLKTQEPAAASSLQAQTPTRPERREPAFDEDSTGASAANADRVSAPSKPLDEPEPMAAPDAGHDTPDTGTETEGTAPDAAAIQPEYRFNPDLIDDDSPLPDEDEDNLTDEDLVAELEAALQDEHLESTQPLGQESSLDDAELDDNLESILEEDDFNQTLAEISLESELDEDLVDLDDRELAAAEAELDAILADTDNEEDLDDMPRRATARQEERFSVDDDEDGLLFQDNPEEDKAEGRYHTGKLIADDELSDSFKELDGQGRSAQFGEDLALNDEAEQPSDESWAEEMLEELESTRQAAPSPEPAGAATPAFKEHGFTEETNPEPIRAAPIAAYDRLKFEPIAVEEEEPNENNLLRVIGWTLLNVLLLIGLAGQLAWFHYDKLARNDNLRPLYAMGCQWLGCQLPPLQDISQIKSQNLVVRSHPVVNKALVIDVMVVNQATFEQPFPNIAFQFSDLNGKVVAHRVFEPQDYLAGEARELTAMPPETPVHISLEILDPGAEAVNYTMSFKPRPGVGT